MTNYKRLYEDGREIDEPDFEPIKPVAKVREPEADKPDFRKAAKQKEASRWEGENGLEI